MFSSPFSFDLHENTAGIKVTTFSSKVLPNFLPNFNEMYYYPSYYDKQVVAAGSVTKTSRLCWITDYSSNKNVGMISLLTVGSSHISQIHLVLDYCETPKPEGHESCFY